MKTLPLTFQNLQTANRERSNAVWPQCNEWDLNDWMLALVGEVGELINEIKHLKLIQTDSNFIGLSAKIDQQRQIDDTKLKARRELADIIIYADLFAQALDVELAAVIIEKFNHTSQKVGSDIRLTYGA